MLSRRGVTPPGGGGRFPPYGSRLFLLYRGLHRGLHERLRYFSPGGRFPLCESLSILIILRVASRVTWPPGLLTFFLQEGAAISHCSICLLDGPRRPGAVKRPWRFPM